MAKKESRRARKARESGGGGSKSPLLVIGLALVVGLGIYLYLGSGAGGTAIAPVDLDPTVVEDTDRLAELGRPVVEGNPDAPVTIAEFADFQCPACRAFHASVKPQIESTYVDPGEAQFHFYDFPLTTIHAHAFLAARAARCARDQGQFWLYHDVLFARQDQWSVATSPASNFVEYAGEIGLDQNAFETCLRSDRFADVVTAQMALGRGLGISGTPSVIVSVQRPGGSPVVQRVQSNNFEGIQSAVVSARQRAGLPAAAESDTAGGEAGSGSSGGEG